MTKSDTPIHHKLGETGEHPAYTDAKIIERLQRELAEVKQDRDSWRRTSENLQSEKQRAEQRLAGQQKGYGY